MFNSFPIDRQMDSQDCGPACLKMIAKYFGRFYSLQYLRDKCSIGKNGVSMLDLSNGAESIGLRTLAVKITIDQLVTDIPLPVILYWKESHYIVVYKTSKKSVYVADPAKGIIKYSKEEFVEGWYLNEESIGVALAVEPTADFRKTEKQKEISAKYFSSILSYFMPYKQSFGVVFFIMLIVTLLQGILPFISKAVIDVGIKTHDIKFINMILFGNVAILFSITIFNVIRDWVLLHVTSRVNISMISDYLIKLMNLPVAFFENKLLGDILQRAQDHERIRNFIMNNFLSLVFSILTFIIFGLILLWYSSTIFWVFMAGSVLYVGWVLIFLHVRKKLDWEYFEIMSKDQSFWVETITAIDDIKIANYEKQRRWKWEEIQAQLYFINKKVMSITNAQNLGSQFIDNIKNMAIVFLCALAVIKGEITFGVMISTQFILGMLNAPLASFINFIISAQYAKISFMRMNEIKQLPDESEMLNASESVILPEGLDVKLSNVAFQYSSSSNPVLKNINLIIPEGKVTAIVGGSGSGKSTLLKLLLRLYKTSYGNITVGGVNMNNINLHQWRSMCGVVMQDGKMFSDTVLNNIVLDDDKIDYEKVRKVCKIAQIDSEIDQMPKGYNTKIGENGRGLSGGQKQRILIARALYREPKFLFLDEATNALDGVNEQKVVAALKESFIKKTVIVVAHRLSTIKSADQIVVLDNGYIVEVGSHEQLITYQHGIYTQLVASQGAFST